MQASEEVTYEDPYTMELNSCYGSSNLNTKDPYAMELNSCYGSSNLNTSNGNECPVVNISRKGGLSSRHINMLLLIVAFSTVTALVIVFSATYAMSQRNCKENLYGLKKQIQTLSVVNENLKSQIEFLNLTRPSQQIVITSCSSLSKSSPSGYYWVKSSNGSAINVFCDMTRTCGPLTGGWMRVTSLDMKMTSSQCPSVLCRHSNTIKTVCHICPENEELGPHYSYNADVVYNVGINYSKVCGRIIGYQIGTPDGYSRRFSKNGGDGVFLSYRSQGTNIWAFVAALSESAGSGKSSFCSCINPSDPSIPIAPPVIGGHYFCDTAAKQNIKKPIFYSENPLWDGAGCEGVNECCSFNNPPWFYRELAFPTSEDIKMRIQLDENKDNEDIAIETVDIYVQ